ncbi:MAG: stage II sporulation protein M [Acidobacteria bacterium]|nr:stage II sporulation protein M [Acidobacteriota bacterium]
MCANAAVLAGTVATGWILSESGGVELPVNPPRATGAEFYWILVANNSRVLVSLVAGALTFGIYTSLVLMWNGYFLGVGLANLRRVAPELLPLAAPHVALEFTALLLGASAAWVLLGDCIGCLAYGRPMRLRGIAVAVGSGFFLLMAAAWFEVRLVDEDFSAWDILSR